MMMVYFRSIIIFLLVACCCVSCAQPESGGWLFKKVDPDVALFTEAQQKQMEHAYEEAYVLYREHYDRYPQSRHAPHVVFFLGQVSGSLERYDQARQYFQEVIFRYPETDLAREARVQIMEVFYRTGDYEQAIRYADEILPALRTEKRIVRVHRVMGDAHLAMGNGAEALGAFVRAYESAGKEDRDRLSGRIRAAAAVMPVPQLRSILDMLNGRPPADEILYLLGIRYLEEGEYREAKFFLEQFAEQYPRHPDADAARQLIDDIPVTDLFDKNTVGCLLPLSGRYENFGQQALKGIELALTVFSDVRKQDASNLKIIIRDTASNAAGAASAVQDLHGRQVAAVIGPMIEAEAAAIEAQRLGVPIVTLTQKPDIPDMGEWVFRNFLTPAMQVEKIVSYAVNDLRLSRFAILYPEETYGQMFMNLFWDAVIASGGQVVGVESYRPDQTNFSDPIRKLTGMYYEVPESLEKEAALPPVVRIQEEGTEPRPDGQRILSPQMEAGTGASGRKWYDAAIDTAIAAEYGMDAEAVDEKDKEPSPIIDFDAVFIPDSPSKAGLIMPYLAYQDVKDVHLLGTNLWHSDRLIQMAGSHGRNAVFPEGFFARSDSEHVSRFVALFEKTYGYTPGFIEAVSYDTAMMIFDAVCRPEIQYRSQLRKRLIDMAVYQGVTGRTRFSETGEAVKDVYLLRISGSRFREIPVRPRIQPDQGPMSW
jgi:branched-chain amino acid transport system substrate-binding protein